MRLKSWHTDSYLLSLSVFAILAAVISSPARFTFSFIFSNSSIFEFISASRRLISASVSSASRKASSASFTALAKSCSMAASSLSFLAVFCSASFPLSSSILSLAEISAASSSRFLRSASVSSILKSNSSAFFFSELSCSFTLLYSAFRASIL